MTLLTIGCRLSAIDYRLSAIDHRLSTIGYRLSTIGYRLREALDYAGQSPPARERADYVFKDHK
ncbi:MAG: hypothetical protein K6T87_12275 [Roseiflexus sp.]|uniref:hypothetical protein n=1 Tax=Roseiflexus sp. TaxID=2562120 RepID=UPI0025F10C57|nr:hypothetical protein [Roseiflexus sp.]MCL6541332.1 hypothetical protein [Roseiflexus sp.]